MKPQTAPSPSSTATREKILNAAELLFIDRGFAATSLRAIATKAGVNLAATHYHFGSKNGLLAEVFHRRIAPINEQRLSELARLTQDGEHLTARKILEAFFRPFTRGDLYAAVPAVIGRIYGEPDTLTKPILENEFGQVSTVFQGALASVLPNVNRQELQWRFHFMIGSMIHLLRLNTPLGMKTSRGSFRQGLEQLINFSIAGLEQAGAGEHDD